MKLTAISAHGKTRCHLLNRLCRKVGHTSHQLPATATSIFEYAFWAMSPSRRVLCRNLTCQHAIELAAVPASLHQPLRHPRRRTHAVGCAGAVAFAVCGVLCQVSKGGGTSRRRRGCRAAAAVCATGLARNQIHGRVERKRFSTHAAASSNSCQHHRHHVNALEAAAIVTTCGLVQAAELLTTATKIQMLKCSELSHSTGANCS